MIKPVRKSFFVSLIIAAPIVTAAVLAWLLSLEGTVGMYQWIPQFQGILIAVGVLGISGPLLSLVGRERRFLRSTSVVLAVLGILVPLGMGGMYLKGALQFATTTPPLLLIADGVGNKGVPNLALVFRTNQATQNTLTFGEGMLNQKVTEQLATREHVLPLVNLSPGTLYQWRLNDGSPCTFTTPGVQPVDDTLYHFGAGGDPHFSGGSGGLSVSDATILPAVFKYVTAQGSASPFHTFFLLGDFANMGSDFADWEFGLNLVAPFTCSVPLRPVMGNHDTYTNGAPQYEAYFYPQNMDNPNGSRSYYRIDSGRIHFILLKMPWGTESFTGEQRAWFIKQMESIPADDWTIVMEHSVVYSSASMEDGKQYFDPVNMVEQVAPLFEKFKVDLVITGHEHQLEFLQKNGVSYATVGGLGAPLEDVATNKSIASVWYLPKQHGFLDVTVHPDTIDLIFRDPSGVELKSFSIGQNQ